MKPFVKGGEVSNYPTKKINPEDNDLLNKISLKRKIEIMSKTVSLLLLFKVIYFIESHHLKVLD